VGSFGILSGNIIYLGLVAIGVGVVGKNLYFQLVVGTVGGLYLLNIAKVVFYDKPTLNSSCNNLEGFKVYKEALLLNLSNPKAMIFFAVIVTPFMGKSILLSLFFLFVGISLAFFVTAFVASSFNIKETLLIAINKIASVIFVAFAIGLFSSAYRAYLLLLQ
jgi:threonine/homoserine/homoserine lactone efflux protein